MKRKILLVALFLIASLVFAPVSFAAQQVNLVSVSASPGGAWFATMGALAELIHAKDPSINIKSTPGNGAANSLAVALGTQAQMGFTFPPFAIAAMDGTEPFEGRPKAAKLRAIHSGFGASPIQFVLRKDFADKYGIKTFKDIADKKAPIRIVTDNPGTSDEFAGRKVLEFYGITYDNVKAWGGSVTLTGYTDSVQLMQDGHVDMAINNIGAPAGPFVEMQLNVPLIHMSLDDAAIKHMSDKFGHVPHTIPKGTYKEQNEDIRVAAMYTVVIINADIPDDVVYRITKIICENEASFRTFAANTGDFVAKTAYQGCGIPLHPGAEKYFKEMGYMK